MRLTDVFLGGALAAISCVASIASAAEIEPFDKSSFEAAQKQGKPIVVDIAASWCPTCAAQKPIVDALVADPAYKDMVVFHMDFDTQKESVRAVGAQMQSTLIAYSGDKETGRSVGDTNPGSIGELFASTLGN